MKNLTAEKCRELLEEIKYNRENCFLSEKTKMLMDIAESVILEQQERGCQKCGGTGMADSGGTQPWGEQILIECDCKFEQQERGEGDWIEWGGGKCPFSDDMTEIEVKFAAGDVVKGFAGTWWWGRSGDEDDIIAYRIIPEQPTNENGEQ